MSLISLNLWPSLSNSYFKFIYRGKESICYISNLAHRVGMRAATSSWLSVTTPQVTWVWPSTRLKPSPLTCRRSQRTLPKMRTASLGSLFTSRTWTNSPIRSCPTDPSWTLIIQASPIRVQGQEEGVRRHRLQLPSRNSNSQGHLHRPRDRHLGHHLQELEGPLQDSRLLPIQPHFASFGTKLRLFREGHSSIAGHLRLFEEHNRLHSSSGGRIALIEGLLSRPGIQGVPLHSIHPSQF